MTHSSGFFRLEYGHLVLGAYKKAEDPETGAGSTAVAGS